MDLKGCALAFGHGMLDSVKGVVTMWYIDRELNARQLARLSPPRTNTFRRNSTEATPLRPLKEHEVSKAGKRILQCCLLNGGVFLFSIAFFQYCFLPSLGLILGTIFGENSFVGRFVWSWMKPTLTCFFQTLWVIPLFLLSKVVNSLWFQDIANSAYRYSRGRPQFIQSISVLLADCILSILLQTLFLFQTFAVSYIPIYMLGQVLYIVHMCMLYSLYAFEYKWFNMAWELHKRLTYIETNWPYFIGFGLPLAILTNLSDSWILSGAIFSIFFPFFIISANEANPIGGVCDYPLHLFSPVIGLSNLIFVRSVNSNENARRAPSASRR